MLGALNGTLVKRLGLPSLAVTLGTMGAFRGLAFIVGTEVGYTDFGDPYLYVGSELIAGVVPVSFVLFLIVALGVSFLMHGTVFGPPLLCGRQRTGRRLGSPESTSRASKC